MTHLAYVDCSNLFIEGQKVSAVAKVLARSLEDAKQQGVIDFDYRLDRRRLMALLQQAGGGEGDTRAVVFGSVTSSNEELWRHAVAAGFEVVTVERGFGGKEKRGDTSLVTRLCRDAYRFGDPRRDRVTLVASDGSSDRGGSGSLRDQAKPVA